MAAVSLVVFEALALATLAVPRALSGEEVHCIRDRAHLVRFNLTGDPGTGSSLAHIKSANITLEPSAAHPAHCQDQLGRGLSDGEQHCWGMNQDSSCQRAERDVVPLPHGLECKNCFAAASTTSALHLGIKDYRLDSLTFGLKDLRLQASASINKELSASKAISHKMTMPSNNVPHTLINITVGCPLCVPVQIAVTMTSILDYTVQGSGETKFRAGVEFAAELGNSLVSYAAGRGWSHEIPHLNVFSTTPIFRNETHGTADLNIGLDAAVKLTVEKLGWLHVGAKVTMPGHLTSDAGVGPDAKPAAEACMDAKAHAVVTQEADLDVAFGLWSDRQHWGPTTLADELKEFPHECVRKPSANKTATVIV